MISNKFDYGNFLFTYYRFIDRFHVEPRSWQELMEFPKYLETDTSVNKLIADTKQEK